ncbi:MAG: 50S ribosomal protein L37ae [Candidatus Aenigmarchaeota archaeon]|nr:50S ribosomal protein L37ae [Candidatus Aenigmarchaeota archaeon]
MAKKIMHGRFGSKYGKRIREDVLKAIEKSKTLYKCPSCSRISVKRLASGIWQCKKCSVKYASGAYAFKE